MAALPEIAPDTTPQLTYRTKRKFEPRSTSFPAEVDEEIKHWLHEQIRVRRKQLERRHKVTVPEWEKIAAGRPKQENKSWPFDNCSNLVHQIVGEAVDDMAARVMGIVWLTAPVAMYRYFVKSANQEEMERNSRKAKLLEQAMDYFAYEPSELGLYERENVWFSTSAKLGTAWLAVVPEQRVEAVYVGYDTGKKKTEFRDATLYEGPRVLNLRDQDVLYDPSADCPEDSDFFSRRAILTRRQLQEREFRGLYKAGTVAKILGRPDRYGPGEVQRKEQRAKGEAGGGEEDRVLAEWDIEECYFYWYHNRKKYRLLAWFHYETKTVMNQIFNFFADNQIPIVRTRLASGEKGMNGRGLSDMGKDAQDEISTAKNQRNDAITWGMLGLNRISTMNRNIDRNFRVFPGATMPFGKDEFEHYSVAEPAMAGLSMQNETAMIQQARERFGVGPAVAGQGVGQLVGRGRNTYYSAYGAMASLQDANTRVAHRTSDFRASHIRLFGLLTDMYGAMGLGRKGSLFGLDDRLLTEALEDYLERRVRIPIRASTASVNREVSKQNLLLLNRELQMYTAQQSKMIQAVMSAQLPESYRRWLIRTIKANVRLMQQVVRDFQLSDQPEEYVPEVELEEEAGLGKKEGASAGVTPLAGIVQEMGRLSEARGESSLAERRPGPQGTPPAALP